MAGAIQSGHASKDTDSTLVSVVEDSITSPDPNRSASTKITDFKNEIVTSFTGDSHDLAHQEHENKGEAQKDPGAEVRDLGWHKKPEEMPGTLIGGVQNDDLFAMIRRFNKDVFDVQALPLVRTTGLDLTESWNDENATTKLTLHLERAYLSIVLGLATFGKQVARLRSWKETRRTAAFCMAYSLAWALNLLVPLLLGILVVIIASEKARNALFPPAPLALVDISTGGLQTPHAGELGTTETITGAPERATGEAREEEAANFVENIRHLITRSMGMHDGSEEEGDPLQGKVPKPIQKGLKKVKEAGSDPGHATEKAGKDLTQKPMEDLLWDMVQPKVVEPVIKAAPHIVGDVVDNWERFANAISPTPPFSRLAFLRIEAILVPLFLTSLLVPQELVYKTTGFAIGFGLFGDPIISRGLEFLDVKFPNWLEMLEPKNNVLRGVPTNNQITLTLLRIGEAHRSPIPSIPDTKPTDPVNTPTIETDQIPLAASTPSITQATSPPPEPSTNPEDEQPKHRHFSKIIGIFKGNTKAVVETKLATDHVRAAAGSEKAEGHLGVVQNANKLVYAGPSDFKARFSGEKGWLHISNPTSDIQRLVFLTEKKEEKWSIGLTNIKRLKRATAFANKPAEKAAEWSPETELLGSLEVVDEGGKTWRFTAVPERDELFNRLIAVGGQRWENM